MPFLYKKEEGREYRRYKHTAQEQKLIRSKGFTPVVSSNVSAIARDDKVLFVRFHDSSTYSYPKSGELFDKMLHSKSKGKFVWNELIRKNVPYSRASYKDFSTGAEIEQEPPLNIMEQAKQERQSKGEQIVKESGLKSIINTATLLESVIAGFALASLINGNTPSIVDKLVIQTLNGGN